MAAIAGIFNRNGKEVDESSLKNQIGALQHRGTMQPQVYVNGCIGFVQLGNEILPGKSYGDQITQDASGRYTLISHGRIFNDNEIRDQLENELHIGRNLSIVELMLEAFKCWGDQAFERLNGEFSCAIWDNQSNQLTLVRDPCGIKQLFFSITSDYVVFASEVKGVFADPRVSKNPDPVGIVNYLLLNRFLFPAENTFYQTIERLQAATIFNIDRESDRQHIFWRLDPNRHDSYANDQECIESIRELIVDAVRIRMPEGDRLGAALSGGFDSSSIVCLMDHINRTERTKQASLDTFSFNFDSDDADEIELIDLVADRVGAKHHHTDALPPSFFDDMDAFIHIHDGPLLESSVLCLWGKKSAASKAGINVLLSGLGGDEIFMGTLHYFSDLFRRGQWGTLYKVMKGVYPIDKSTGKPTSLSHLWRAYIISPLIPYWLRQLRGVNQGNKFPPDWIAKQALQQTGLGEKIPTGMDSLFSTAFDNHNFTLFHYELLGGAIPYHDEASAAFGIETRFPYLDTRLVEAMFAIDRAWKLDGDIIRKMQKSAMQPFLPKEILDDHLKKNFHFALHRFTQRVYEKPIRELLKGNKQLSREYMDWKVLEQNCDAFFSGKTADPTPIWLAMNLERWLKTF